ncbi:YceD family protein [Corynebacterium epidermidicanis]|uniref:Putative metal-binding protein, possibly nucleic-acid binding n=1 Tax=Corynebacterium epidermidicanis TaxID=1050174 RepID=A0A0G3GV92_9CORY|nr:YceD family protein [Corynebacterium epidermidicanis]AKK03453.1 putative metal-binding protein, possibly nucleic-acid binding [Corynebacterium epidermidicanis]
MTSPFIFDCAALLRGGLMPETRTQTGPSPARIGIAMMAIDEGEEVSVAATLTPLGEGIMVDADVTAKLTGQCARCLDALHPERTFHINEVFAASADFIQGDDPDSEEDELPMVVDNRIDLLQSVIDVVGLELPFNPTCQDFGLECSDDEVPAPDGVSGEENDLIDPRWAGLEKFK